ncbi:MAG: dienelactone hydrolase family protein [Acidimicrobiales bacterium]
MATNRTETITAADGGTFDGYVWAPSTGKGAGILLLQEIFGVGSYLRAVAERLCEVGYTVLAPDLFWRIEKGVALDHDADGLKRGIELVSQFDFALGLKDCEAALAHLRTLPETDGHAGVVGFCLGGRIAYSVATQYAPDVAVSYYGSGISDALDEAATLECPILFHFGDDDAYIPIDQVTKVKDALASRPNVGFHVYSAGHAFDNHEAPIFYQREAAEEAWGRTLAFLEKEMPPSDRV